jgi:hypothetical protein
MAWAIYCWIADRIAYNGEALMAQRMPDCSPDTVLSQRLTVCEGYANLFLSLCTSARLEAVKLHGHSKGYGYIRGDKAKPNHAWNAVKIDGGWNLVDVTWGTGHLDQRFEFIKRFNPYYFLTPPDQLIFSHLPEEPRWQLLDPPVAAEDYERWPRVGVALFKFGVAPGQIHLRLEDRSFRGFVQTYDPDIPLRLHLAPLERNLRAGQEYEFVIECPACSSMIVSNNSERVTCLTNGKAFYARVRPRQGRMQVAAQFPEKGRNVYWTILDYTVEADNAFR